LTFTSENIDTNSNVTLNMGRTSPSTGVSARGGGCQHLTLVSHGKGVTNTLNIFALKHTALAFFKNISQLKEKKEEEYQNTKPK